MYFKQIMNEDGGCSSYVIASRLTGEAAAVDPALDIDQYLDLARSRGFTFKYVIDTHIHADHVSGARRLAAETGAELCLHESADVLFPFRGLKDGEIVRLGQLELEVLHSPGHRPEMISVLVTNPPRGDQPSLVLTGDALFVGDVGRPDFGGAAGAAQQYESVHRLMQLEDYVEVFPAHFEGSCGKGMCGRPSSTIGFERRFNPLLTLDREAFINATEESPARPLNMTAIVATNRGAADFPEAEPRIVDGAKTIDVERAAAWVTENAPVILDVREPEEYAAGHLPGALSVPQAELAGEAASLDKDRDYLVVCAGGIRSLRATHYLTWLGFDRAVSLNGGTNGWAAAGLPIEGTSGPGAEKSAAPERYQHAAPLAGPG